MQCSKSSIWSCAIIFTALGKEVSLAMRCLISFSSVTTLFDDRGWVLGCNLDVVEHGAE